MSQTVPVFLLILITHGDHTFVYFDSEKAEDAAARTIAASRSQGVRRSTSVVLMKAEVKLIDLASHPWTR